MRTSLPGPIVAASLAMLAWVAPAAAHIALTSPSPRSVDQKAGPCGLAGSTRGTAITTYAPGETITVEWDETVDHPGHYRIAFVADGDDFPVPVRSTDAFPETLVDQIADHVGGHYTQQVTLPDVTCDNCTLQLIQVMQVNEPYNSFYFQCTDLVLSATGGDDDDGGGGATSGGCSATGSPAGGTLVLALIGLAAIRRRRG